MTTTLIRPREITPSVRAAGARTLAVLILLGTIGERILGFWHPEPGPNGRFGYDYVSGVSQTWWAMHFFGAVAVTMQAVSLSLAVYLLVPARGSRFALTGGLLASLGALLFSVGIASEGVVMAYATDTDALAPAAGADFLTYVEKNPALYIVGIVPGLFVGALGVVLLAVALWRAHSVSRWVPGCLAAGTVAGFALPFGIVGGLISAVTLTPAILAVGWYTLRVASAPS
jgi:hypothetical protein